MRMDKNVRTYVTLRSDHYLSLLALVGAMIMRTLFGWDFFHVLEIIAFSYVVGTTLRDWNVGWITFRIPPRGDSEDGSKL